MKSVSSKFKQSTFKNLEPLLATPTAPSFFFLDNKIQTNKQTERTIMYSNGL